MINRIFIIFSWFKNRNRLRIENEGIKSPQIILFLIFICHNIQAYIIIWDSNKFISMSYYAYLASLEAESALRRSRVAAELAASRAATESALRRSRIEAEVAAETAVRRSRI